MVVVVGEVHTREVCHRHQVRPHQARAAAILPWVTMPTISSEPCRRQEEEEEDTASLSTRE